MGHKAKQRFLNIEISNGWAAHNEMFKVLTHQGNLSITEIPFYVGKDGLDKKTQVAAHAGEDVEQGEFSSISAGIADLYKHCGNEVGSFSENWE